MSKAVLRAPLLLLSLSSLSAVVASCASPPSDDAGSSDDALSYGDQQQCSKSSPTKGRCFAEADVARVLRTAGFPERIVPAMVCTAKWESGFYERAVHTNGNKSTDRGVFQVNSVHLGEKGCPANAEGLFDAQTNAGCARVVYEGQQRGSSDPLAGVRNAWVAFRAHQTECASYRLPPALASASATATATASAGVDPGRPAARPNDAAAPAGDDDDIPDVPPPPNGSSNAGGSCFAGTLGQSLPAGGCYQRKQDGIWFQCHGGLWYRGVSADGTTGPYGDCSPSFPLAP